MMAPLQNATQLLCLMALFLITGAAACGQGVETADHRFVHGLMDRQLYGLAESYCLAQFEQTATAGGKAQWVLTLTDCWKHRSWQEEHSSRDSLLKLAAARITEFLASTVVPPGLELRLRLQQIHCLMLIPHQERIVRRAAHLHRVHQQPSTGDESSSKLLETTERLTTAMLRQLEEIKQDLDPGVVRALRSEAKLLLAQIHLLQGQATEKSSERAAFLRKSQDLAESLARSGPDLRIPILAQIVLIRILQAQEELDAALLRVQALRGQSSAVSHQLAAVQLSIELQLQQQRGNAALQLWIHSMIQRNSLHRSCICVPLRN